MQVSSLRISIAALCLLPFFLHRFREVNRRYWPALLVVGLLGTGIPTFCYPIAETRISSMTAGILNSLTPLFTLLFGALFFHTKTTRSGMLGVVLGLLGAILMILRKNTPDDANVYYGLFIVLGAMCYAMSGNTVKARLQALNPISIGVLSFTILGPAALAILFTTNIVEVMQTDPNIRISLPAVCFLSIFGTAAASILYFRLVHMTSAVFASLVAYLIPVVAVLLGMLDGESITWTHGLGLLLIAAGIYLSRSA